MTTLEATPAASEGTANPYVGLSFYRECDAPFFFGRDAERQVIMGNLRASRLTLLYAESGVGKSSLLRAGVAARLRELAQQIFTHGGSACYIPVVFSSWRDDPVEQLIGEIQDAANAFLAADAQIKLSPTSLRAAIEAAVLALDEAAARNAADPPSATLLIILDQFEEYFLYGSREARVARLADELTECVRDVELRANLLISIRQDAYSTLGDLLKSRMSNVYGNYLHLEHLTLDAAREAIEKPIERYNSRRPGAEAVTIEQGLVEAVLSQVRHEPDGEPPAGNTNGDGAPVFTSSGGIVTPYLQLVMTTLWERERSQGSHTLRLSTLAELHGAERIVARHLDGALGHLDPQSREAAVDMLHHLVTPSGTKIALEVGDLAAYTHRPAEQVAGILHTLAGEARIVREVPPAPGSPSDDDTYRRFEIYHDVLAGPINDAVSVATTRRLEHEKEAAEQQARRERRHARVFRTLAVVSLVLVVIAAIAVALATVETDHARTAEHGALSRQLAGQAIADLQNGDVVRGTLLSLEAYQVAATGDADSSIVRAQQATQPMVTYMGGHSGPVTSVAFSPDGRRLASAGNDGRVIVWDTATSQKVAVLPRSDSGLLGVAFSRDGRMLAAAEDSGALVLWNAWTAQKLRVLLDAGPPVESVAFSPSGDILASAGDDGAVTLWDTTTGRPMRTLTVGKAPVYSVAFARDGSVLASGDGNGGVVLWDLRTSRRVRTIHAHMSVYSIAFRSGRNVLAVGGSDRSAALYDFSTGRKTMVLRGHTNAISSVAFSPDGKLVASGSDDQTVRLQDARSGRLLALLTGPLARVITVAFSPDGRTVASGSEDGSLIIWKAQPSTGSRTFSNHDGSAWSVAFSPDGRMVASPAQNGVTSIWDASTGRQLKSLSWSDARVESVAFSPDARILATASDDRAVILWHTASGQRLRVLRGHTDKVYAVAFSPDGGLLASAGADHKVIVWSVSSGRVLRTLAGHTNAVNAVAFSRDGRLLASGSSDDQIIFWNPMTGRRQRTLNASSAVLSLAFSPDGKTLASAGAGGTVTLWDAKTGQRPGADLVGHQDQVTSVGFSPSGKLIASGSGDSTVVVWNPGTGLGVPVTTHLNAVTSVAFSPDGRTIASASRDGTVAISPVRAPTRSSIFEALCGVVRRNLTQAEWHRVAPDQSYRRTCPQ